MFNIDDFMGYLISNDLVLDDLKLKEEDKNKEEVKKLIKQINKNPKS